MFIEEFDIADLKLITPKKFGDSRGFFLESYHQEKYLKSANISCSFVQDNISMSPKGILRGLHFQKNEFAQAKLVTVLQGKAFDVAVDLRKNSPTFGQHQSVVLDSSKIQFFYIPRGFAHGFLSLEDNTLFSYKCDNFYSPENESGLFYNDPDLNIKWPSSTKFTLSDKDKILPNFKEFSI